MSGKHTPKVVTHKINKLEVDKAELLAALESLLCVVRDDPGEGCDALLKENDPCVTAARAAIRKATGEDR